MNQFAVKKSVMKSFVIPLRNAKNKIYLFHLEKILNEKLVPEGSKRVKFETSAFFDKQNPRCRN